MTITFDEALEITEQISKIENENRVSSQQLEQIFNLEKQFQNSPISAAIADEITQIQCIVNEANKLTQKKEFYLLSRKVDQAISEIKLFHSKHQEPLPEQIFNDLTVDLEVHSKSISSLKRAIKRTTSWSKRRIKSTKALKNFAHEIEIFAKALEGNIEFFPYHRINDLQNCFKQVEESLEISAGSGKPFIPDANKYLKQIQKVAQSLIPLLEIGKERILAFKSAEAKAIERIEDIESTAWETVLEAEQEINIEQMNAWLKERGYTTKIPCEDTPTGQESRSSEPT